MQIEPAWQDHLSEKTILLTPKMVIPIRFTDSLWISFLLTPKVVIPNSFTGFTLDFFYEVDSLLQYLNEDVRGFGMNPSTT